MRTLPRSRTRQITLPRVDPGSRLFRTPLAATISAILATGALPLAAQAASPAADLPEIIVTATRRAEDIQDIPLNIAAIGGEQLTEQGIADLATLGRSVPGLYVVDQGKRTSNRIVVRGLNATSVSGPEGIGNTGGQIVSTYVGEIPLYLDLRLEDMDRVEVLMGPQGTLYGAGTLGGAIRYIPRRPEFDTTSVTLRGSGYSLSEADDIGARGGITANLPLGDLFSVRASLDYVDDPGFIDAPFLVREAGVSDPEPNFASPAAVAANLRSQEDVDYEKTVAGRIAVRARPEPGIDVNFTHYFQDMEVGSRTASSRDSIFATGAYESNTRYLEPNDRQNRLTALEITADLGFAQLTSATGYAKYTELGGRDQTDLLITLEYSYEAFPTFSAFTREEEEETTLTQEIRLVSNNTGPLSWIGGFFYNDFDGFGESREFTPEYDAYLGVSRPDSLEYISQTYEDLVEKALFGEIGYQLTDQWQVTVGARYYDYTYETQTGTDLPLLYVLCGKPCSSSVPVQDRYFYGPDDIFIDLEPASQSDSGTLFKFNTAYQFADDLMGYLTVSEGYRIGASNGLAACDPNQGQNQNVCGQPDELQYVSDSTINYEIGMRTQWFDRRLTLNGSVYFIDWQDPQLTSATAVGAQPITKNGKGAETQGFELSFNAQLTPSLSIRGSYAYTQAELTEDATALLRTFVPPGFRSTQIDVDALAGDRLPGSPEQQGTFALSYDIPVGTAWELGLDYGLTTQGDVYTRTGLRAGGEVLPGFTVHSAAATLRADAWSLSLYAQNLFDKYAYTGVRATPAYNQATVDENGDTVRVRTYYHDLLRPREVGLRFTYDFEL